MSTEQMVEWLNMILFGQGGYQPGTNPLTVMTGET